MKEYEIKVNFKDGTIDSDFMELVENDYNSTTLNFKFDINERVVLKILYPDKTIAYVNDIVDNKYVFEPGLLTQEGNYEMELAAYDGTGRLTNYATMRFYVRPELISTDEIVEPDDRVPILDNLINEVDNINISATKEDDVATIIVTKKDGTTETVEVYDGEIGPQGEQGPKGDKGDTGAQGPQGIQGPKGDTGPQGIQGPKGDKGDTGSQGAVGPAGATGPQGPKGDKGDKGDTGSEGPTGPQGPKGDKGDPGLTQQEVQDLIDASIEELGELGFTPTVVQVLPTEDIDEHTIYLVPKQDSEQEDAYDEWLYINNAWEHIGSTAVDLSNYYTKSEVDALLTSDNSYIISPTEFNSNLDYLSQELLQTAFNKMLEGKRVIIIRNSSSSITVNDFPLIFISPTNLTLTDTYTGRIYFKTPMQLITNVFPLSSGKVYNTPSYRYIYMKVTNGIVTGSYNETPTLIAANSTNQYTQELNVLSKINSAEYTPTQQYHPATKKYVDDSIASAITDALGGEY